MDLSAARCRLSPEEWQKWIDESHYLYCSSINHIAHDCPNKPKVSGRPLHGAVAKIAAQPENRVNPTSTSQSGNI
jgi:hypothetical protein